MSYVLVMVIAFSSASGVATDARTQEFANEAACEAARAGIEEGVSNLKGTLGRAVFAACYAKQ